MACSTLTNQNSSLLMDVSEEIDLEVSEEVIDECLSSTQKHWYSSVSDAMSSFHSLQFRGFEKAEARTSIEPAQSLTNGTQLTFPPHSMTKKQVDLTTTVNQMGNDLNSKNNNENITSLEPNQDTVSLMQNTPMTALYQVQTYNLGNTNGVNVEAIQSLCVSGIQQPVPNAFTECVEIRKFNENNLQKCSVAADAPVTPTSTSSRISNKRHKITNSTNKTHPVSQHNNNFNKNRAASSPGNLMRASNPNSISKGRIPGTHSKKITPCLNVKVRPFLRNKYDETSTKDERLILDKQVKDIILKTPAELIEWCIMNGLVRPSQVCGTCRSASDVPLAMNLVQYTKSSVHPLTGGYVWRCDQCIPPSEKSVSENFVPLNRYFRGCFCKQVFIGSIFENIPYVPLTIIKLLYHWVNNTDANSIIKWVEIDSTYLKRIFTLLRAVCTSAVHEHFKMFGGSSQIVQIGLLVIKSNREYPKRPVSVLGALDQGSQLIRLQLVESLKMTESCSHAKMQRILKPLTGWIHTQSVISTDFSIDQKFINKLGFTEVHSVFENSSSLQKCSNSAIKNYLKNDVPKLFVDSFFRLPRSTIQQFLDELAWRECWDVSPLHAFNEIIRHIAEQTKASEGYGLVNRLTKIADNPFKNWQYKNVLGDEEEIITV